MGIVSGHRIIHNLMAGSLTGAQLETLLTTQANRASFAQAVGSRSQARLLLNDKAAIEATLASGLASAACLYASPYTDLSNAVAASTAAMNIVAASTTAMNAVAASPTAMNIVAASSTAKTAIGTSGVGYDAIKASSMAIGKYVAGIALLDPALYANMAGVVASSTAMSAVAASSTAINAIGASDTALASVFGSSVARVAFYDHATALGTLTAIANAKTYIKTIDTEVTTTNASHISANAGRTLFVTHWVSNGTSYAGAGVDTYTTTSNTPVDRFVKVMHLTHRTVSSSYPSYVTFVDMD